MNRSLLPPVLAFILLFPLSLLANDIEPVEVGMLIPLSGAYAPVGEDNRRGIEMALAESNSASMIKPVYGDSRADPLQSVNEFRKLTTSDKVAGVFAFRGPVGMAVCSLAEAAEIPLLGGVGNKDFTKCSKYTFQIWPTSSAEGAFLAEQIYQRGARTIAILTAEDDWPVAVTNGIREAAGSEVGIELTFDQLIQPSETDFRAMISRIRRVRPDAIVLNLGLAQIGPAVRQIRELQLDLPIYSNYFAGQSEVIEAAGNDIIEGVMFVEMQTEFPAFPEGLPGATLSAYIATKMLMQAADTLRRGQANSLYEALLLQDTVSSEGGAFSVQDRVVNFPMLIRVVRDGKVITLN